MLSRETPLDWRRGFELYRRREVQDAYGSTVSVYPEEPDVRTEDNSPEGICFQPVQSWMSTGHITNGKRVKEPGESASGVLEGHVFRELEVTDFDRLHIGEDWFEIRDVQEWPGHRRLLIQRLK